MSALVRSGRSATGPVPGATSMPKPDGVRRHDDVAVEHRRIDAVSANRLQRDLGGDVGLLDRVEDRSLAAHGAVFGQRTACLAHEPHRGVRTGPTVGRSQEWRSRTAAVAGAVTSAGASLIGWARYRSLLGSGSMSRRLADSIS